MSSRCTRCRRNSLSTSGMRDVESPPSGCAVAYAQPFRYHLGWPDRWTCKRSQELRRHRWDIQKRSAGVIRAGGTLVTIAGPPEARPADGLAIDFVVLSDRAQLGEIVQRVRDGRLRTNIGNVATLDDALQPSTRPSGSAGRRSSAFVREPPKRQISEETIPMKAIVVTDQAAGTAGMTLVERPEPPAAINDVIVQIHASGFVPTEMEWPSTWTDRAQP